MLALIETSAKWEWGDALLQVLASNLARDKARKARDEISIAV